MRPKPFAWRCTGRNMVETWLEERKLFLPKEHYIGLRQLFLTFGEPTYTEILEHRFFDHMRIELRLTFSSLFVTYHYQDKEKQHVH